jgi:hypothetical protein
MTNKNPSNNVFMNIYCTIMEFKLRDMYIFIHWYVFSQYLDVFINIFHNKTLWLIKILVTMCFWQKMSVKLLNCKNIYCSNGYLLMPLIPNLVWLYAHDLRFDSIWRCNYTCYSGVNEEIHWFIMELINKFFF